ncbi:flagellar hook-basal body complex protein FliE [Geodermatophilus nigrescens]|uniref:Flagellar hook-basal body complex protein FliE n=1 Tax=Geodermatophilus nigrescens TaxID=1070870 RepID=A0A1M5EB98_9ACTN|nr:flagellar hook-basal body complex protein FliE [Geodermatophilus nigrescens]SHF76508.1 flagellar hook-basal body complex protein FliE [Geodermatophilus nigrescens]
MTSPVGGVSLPTFPAFGALGGIDAAQATQAAQAPQAATQASADGFAAALTGALDELGSLQSSKDALAVQAATGDLRDVHDYMIAAQESSVATEMVVTIKNKAVEAFTEIMRMPV